MTNPAHTLWRARAMILLIALISAVPFGLAWYYAGHPELISRTSNYGTLVIPPRPVEYAELFTRPLSPPAALDELKGRWIMLQIASGPCLEACRDTVYKTRQLRLMLNKEIPRVRRLLLAAPTAAAADLEELLKADEALQAAAGTEALRQTLAEAVGKPLDEGMLLLLDPHANLMLWYAPGFDPYGVLKDLKHLLKASQIG